MAAFLQFDNILKIYILTKRGHLVTSINVHVMSSDTNSSLSIFLEKVEYLVRLVHWDVTWHEIDRYGRPQVSPHSASVRSTIAPSSRLIVKHVRFGLRGWGWFWGRAFWPFEYTFGPVYLIVNFICQHSDTLYCRLDTLYHHGDTFLPLLIGWGGLNVVFVSFFTTWAVPKESRKIDGFHCWPGCFSLTTRTKYYKCHCVKKGGYP